ncbi:GerMN domain-containing protein [Eubacteriales bacterium OttesenSCG-928-K08]|nr:GerMN domain-containing protein [Eubacteriales bacterium OttesenSCG-928-K08]
MHTSTIKQGKTLRMIALVTLICLLVGAMCGCGVFDKWFGGKGEEPILEEPVDSTVGFRRTVLYFQTDDGQMVPVMKLLPWEEGIGRAALNQLIDTDTNRISAAKMGLKNVVPQGVSFVLSISDDAVATVNILGLTELSSAEAEQNMITGIINTLTEFDSISSVRFEFDGKQMKKLSNGTLVDGVFLVQALNPEPMTVANEGEDQYQMTLYFPNNSASLHVPVTRTVTIEPTFMLAMQELVSGPVDITLRNCFPEGTQVLSATLEDGVATVNLSGEFAQLQSTPELELAALESIQLVAKQFASVSALQVQIEGTDYQSASMETMAVPVYVNEYR